MKNLNEELKNLNVEYKVSSDFKNKVMTKIKENKKNESLDSFYSTITKIAYVAAIIVVCTIFVHNSNDISKDNVMGLCDASASEKIDDARSVLSHDMAESVQAGEVFNTSIVQYDSTTKELAFPADKMLGISDIESILKKNDVSILETENDYIIVESEKEKIESLLENFGCQIEIMDDGKIKIVLN